jgi:hypothetical protein
MGFKTIKKSEKYKYVNYRRNLASNSAKRCFWEAHIRRKGESLRAYYDDEKSAALAVDKFLIRLGLEPINILKRKE